MKIYLRALAILYFVGSILHILDIFDLRLPFSTMSGVWQTWIVYLAVFDMIAAVGLWQQKRWGIYVFLTVATSQVLAYSLFTNHFGKQYFLIVFHLVTLTLYFLLKYLARRDSVRSFTFPSL